MGSGYNRGGGHSQSPPIGDFSRDEPATGSRMPESTATHFTKLGLIFLGSGFGGVCRYSLSGWVQRAAPGTFPWGTLIVNVIGCLAIGFLTAAFGGRWLVREEYRVALIVGILGGFTTFSAFGMETFALLNSGQTAWAAGNVALSVGVGVTAVWIGYRLAEYWLGV